MGSLIPLPQQSPTGCCLPSLPPNGLLGCGRAATKLTTGEVVRAGTLHPVTMGTPLGCGTHPRPLWVSASRGEGLGEGLRGRPSFLRAHLQNPCCLQPTPTPNQEKILV